MTFLFILLLVLALDAVICVVVNAVAGVQHYNRNAGQTRGIKLALYNLLEIGFSALYLWLAFLVFQSL